MPKKKDCEHVWDFVGRSCCYRLECPNCHKTTTAYRIKGRAPKIGERVRFVNDKTGETIEVIKK